MADIQPFRGVRYDLGHVGDLSAVVAPPYDVIGPEFQAQLYDRHPCNCVRLILNRPEPGDRGDDERYARAARFFRNWQREGVLATDSAPAIYVYHQVFRVGETEYTRRGLMARVRLEPFGAGRIFPHEETHASAKADRLKLTRAAQANLSQIFSIYPDEESTAQERLEAEIRGVAPVEATDHLGVVHRLWAVTDPSVLNAAARAMGEKPLFIADGHHRYETALNYREELSSAGPLPSDHPAQSVLMMCVSMSDPGMIVLPTHRLFRGLPPIASDDLRARLGDSFTTRVAGEGADLADSLWQEIATRDEQGVLALYAGADQRWLLCEITEQGRARLAKAAPDRSAPWRSLGVSILHRLVLQELLAATDLPKPNYVHLVEEVVQGLEQGDPEADGADYPLAALVMPATLEHIRAISQAGERMPAKSTYFYPKLLSGLVFNPLK